LTLIGGTCAARPTEPPICWGGHFTTRRQATAKPPKPADEIAVRNDPHALGATAADVDDACDFNRDRKVGPTGLVIARRHGTHSSTALKLITVP
jgi:hypothetical protein